MSDSIFRVAFLSHFEKFFHTRVNVTFIGGQYVNAPRCDLKPMSQLRFKRCVNQCFHSTHLCFVRCPLSLIELFYVLRNFLLLLGWIKTCGDCALLRHARGFQPRLKAAFGVEPRQQKARVCLSHLFCWKRESVTQRTACINARDLTRTRRFLK